MMNNKERANYGRIAITFGHDGSTAQPVEDQLVDTLTNIMHYCHKSGIAFDLALDTARSHLYNELNDERKSDA